MLSKCEVLQEIHVKYHQKCSALKIGLFVQRSEYNDGDMPLTRKASKIKYHTWSGSRTEKAWRQALLGQQRWRCPLLSRALTWSRRWLHPVNKQNHIATLEINQQQHIKSDSSPNTIRRKRLRVSQPPLRLTNSVAEGGHVYKPEVNKRPWQAHSCPDDTTGAQTLMQTGKRESQKAA